MNSTTERGDSDIPAARFEKELLCIEGELQTSPVDTLLTWLVMRVNRSESRKGLGIALCVDGLVFSGRLIGAPVYYELLGEREAERIRDANLKARILKQWRTRAENSRRALRDGMVTPKYLHLRNATVQGGAMLPNQLATLWRVLLTSVSAWSRYDVTASLPSRAPRRKP